jgi:hypothetical protein
LEKPVLHTPDTIRDNIVKTNIIHQNLGCITSGKGVVKKKEKVLPGLYLGFIQGHQASSKPSG